MARSISNQIVSAVADEKGVEPKKLGFVLHDYINTDAIESLVAHESESWELTFELPDHTVTITHTSDVFIDETKFDVAD